MHPLADGKIAIKMLLLPGIAAILCSFFWGCAILSPRAGSQGESTAADGPPTAESCDEIALDLQAAILQRLDRLEEYDKDITMFRRTGITVCVDQLKRCVEGESTNGVVALRQLRSIKAYVDRECTVAESNSWYLYRATRTGWYPWLRGPGDAVPPLSGSF